MKCSDNVPSLDIIYEDNHLLIIEKPSNMLTQPDMSDSPSLEELAKKYLKEKYKKQGNIFLHAVHRLDKHVSGLVIFAKTSKALSRMNEQMRNRKITKKYRAKVEGIFPLKKGKLVNHLLHSSHKARVVSEENKKAKKGELIFEVVKKLDDSTVLEIELISGRYHQIRAQLAHLGHPIWGDKKYNSIRNSDAICLHCFLLEFFHPISKDKILLKSSLYI